MPPKNANPENAKEQLEEVQDRVDEITRMEGMPYVYALVSDVAGIVHDELIRMEKKLEFYQEQLSIYARDESHPSDIINQLKDKIHTLEMKTSELANTSRSVTRANIVGLEEIQGRLDNLESDLAALGEAYEMEREYNDKQRNIETIHDTDIVSKLMNLMRQNKELFERIRKLEARKTIIRKVKYVRPKLLAPSEGMKIGQGILHHRPKLLLKSKSRDEKRNEEDVSISSTTLYGLESQRSTQMVKRLLDTHGVNYKYIPGQMGEGLYPKLIHNSLVYYGIKDIASAIRKTHPRLIEFSGMDKPKIPQPPSPIEVSEETDPTFRKIDSLGETKGG